MLAFLVTYNISVTVLLNADIADIQCQIHYLHLEDYFTQQI